MKEPNYINIAGPLDDTHAPYQHDSSSMEIKQRHNANDYKEWEFYAVIQIYRS